MRPWPLCCCFFTFFPKARVASLISCSSSANSGVISGFSPFSICFPRHYRPSGNPSIDYLVGEAKLRRNYRDTMEAFVEAVRIPATLSAGVPLR